jgi:hypothetical protein
MSTFIERIVKLRTSIFEACENSNRDPKQVELLPVSKYQPLVLMQEASALGFTKFGENYVQEGSQKFKCDNSLKLALIGPLQGNKVKQALTTFQEIMTVDRPALVDRLARATEQLDLICAIWIQVNIWSESTKLSGCNFSEINTLFQILKDNARLSVQGFMAIPPPMDTQAFIDMANLRNAWQQRLGYKLRLSMGMSTDFEQAIKHGSDQIRIGTAFFGTRP